MGYQNDLFIHSYSIYHYFMDQSVPSPWRNVASGHVVYFNNLRDGNHGHFPPKSHFDIELLPCPFRCRHFLIIGFHYRYKQIHGVCLLRAATCYQYLYDSAIPDHNRIGGTCTSQTESGRKKSCEMNFHRMKPNSF